MKLLRIFILIDKGTIQSPVALMLSLQEGLNETTECSNKFVFCDMSVAIFWKFNISTKEHVSRLKLSGYSKGDQIYLWAKFEVDEPFQTFISLIEASIWAQTVSVTWNGFLVRLKVKKQFQEGCLGSVFLKKKLQMAFVVDEWNCKYKFCLNIF